MFALWTAVQTVLSQFWLQTHSHCGGCFSFFYMTHTFVFLEVPIISFRRCDFPCCSLSFSGEVLDHLHFPWSFSFRIEPRPWLQVMSLTLCRRLSPHLGLLDLFAR